MKVDRPGANGLSGVRRPDFARSGASVERSADLSGVSQPDQLSLSARTVQVSGLQPALEALPPVRAGMVEQLKAQIARGEYTINPHRLADRLLKARVLDE